MAKGHDCKAFNRLVKSAEKQGCTTEYKKSGVLTIRTPAGTMYNAHAGEKGFHPLRRFLKQSGITA